MDDFLATLIAEPHDDALPGVTFGEFAKIPFAGALMNLAVSGQSPAADHDEEALRAELIDFRLRDIADHLRFVQSDRTGGPIRAPWARKDLDHLSADIALDFLLLGITTYINRHATHKLHENASSS